MSVQAGFAEVDITPPLGTHKIGWLRDIVADQVLDPIFARLAVIECGKEKIAFIQLDTLSIRWTQVNDIRKRITATYGFPGENIMVSATHNHAGPAVSNCGDVARDEAYIATMVEKIVSTFEEALSNLQEATLGFASCAEFNVGFNRRVIMRNGTVCTHGTFDNPNALCMEGPTDPEVCAAVARNRQGGVLGAIVNFTCHPAHHGGGTALSAGYPGVLANAMKANGCPVTLFLNGAAGNVSTSNPCAGGAGVEMEEAGLRLAADVSRLIEQAEAREEVRLGARSATIQLPFRAITDEEIKGTVRGAQRFINPAIYDRGMPALVAKIQRRGHLLAEVQALFLDEYDFVSIPAEYFVEHGLRIKEQTHPRHTLVVAYANGMVGYVPTKHAFERGGYETTFAATSQLAPEAGDMLADCAIELINGPAEKMSSPQ